MIERERLSPASNRFLRFLLAGVVNTLFGFAVYSACMLLGAAVWLALIVGLLAGIAFNFFTTGGYVFRDLSPSRLPRFVTCYLLIYAVNLTLIGWLTEVTGSAIVAQAILSFPIAGLSYVLMSRIVFTSSRTDPASVGRG